MKITVGDLAPEFFARDQDNKIHKLADYRGRWILLYFYPKDDTPGCRREACGMRDNFAGFKKLGVIILGVSVDSVKSHKKFVTKYQLPFTLLADEDKKIVKAYGVWGKKKFLGKEFEGTFRKSFLIEPKGKIAKIYEVVNPAQHAQEVLQDLKKFKNESHN